MEQSLLDQFRDLRDIYLKTDPSGKTFRIEREEQAKFENLYRILEEKYKDEPGFPVYKVPDPSGAPLTLFDLRAMLRSCVSFLEGLEKNK